MNNRIAVVEEAMMMTDDAEERGCLVAANRKSSWRILG